MKSTSSNRNIPTVSDKIRLSHSSNPSYVAVDLCYHALFAFRSLSCIIISYISYMHRESLKDASGGKWRCSQEKNECTKIANAQRCESRKLCGGVILNLKNMFFGAFTTLQNTPHPIFSR